MTEKRSHELFFEENTVHHFPGEIPDLIAGLDTTNADESQGSALRWLLEDGPMNDFLRQTAAKLLDQLPKPSIGAWCIADPELVMARQLPAHNDEGYVVAINGTVRSIDGRIIEADGSPPIIQQQSDLVVIMGGFQRRSDKIVGATLPTHRVPIKDLGGLFVSTAIFNRAFINRPA